ncbi:hypothetical protein COO60DRAFT_1661525 [Scenedesmus sp. NREL 46B-D3]|nr:hypothetical protein COO60DRAFT_1661525 [Scenedesmus sp. NREL 46B-D3]
MAPKREQAPVITPAGKLISLLQQQDKSVRLLACRQLATYAASTGLLQPTVASFETLQTYHASEAAISAALSDPAAAKAASPKKQTGSRDAAPDPEEWLPGPSKALLEAALRAAASLLGPAGTQQQQQQQEGENVQPSACSIAEAACGMHTWLAAQDVVVLARLLQHPSARVQLARSPHWADAFAAAGGVAAAMRLVSSDSSSAARLAAMRLLQRLGEMETSATALMVVEGSQLAKTLVLAVLEAGAAPAALQPKAKLAAADAAKPSSSVSQQVMESGGLAALQALLPEPPAPPLTAEQLAGFMGSSGGIMDAASTDGAKSPHKLATSKGAVESLLQQAPPAQASLVRMLLHMFAPAVLPEQHAAANDRPDGVPGAADAAGCATAQGAGVRAASPLKGAPGSTAAKPAAAAGAKKPGAATGGAHEQAAPGAGAATPRKGGAASSSGVKEQKAAEGQAQPADPLAPPYAAAVKAAALDCLAHLAQDKQAAALTAAQLVPVQQSLARQFAPLPGTEEAAAAAVQQEPAVTAAAPPAAAAPSELASMLEGACALLTGLVENLGQQQLLELPIMPALQAVAQCGLAQQAACQAQQTVARALLLLPEEAFVPPARPPLPQFAWDALGRPYITDGAVLLSSA